LARDYERLAQTLAAFHYLAFVCLMLRWGLLGYDWNLTLVSLRLNMPYTIIRYERAKRYEEVWAEPVTKVAKRYSISDVALRKICKKLAVPLPPLGYWARVAAGKKMPTPPLPKHSGPAEIVRQRYVSDDPIEPDPDHLVARREFEARPENRIVVSERLDIPHPLVAATERALRKSKRHNLHELTTNRQALDISVSQESLPRALRIMDALAKALDARGMPLHIESEGKQRSCLILQDQVLAIRLAEATSRTEREPTETERQEIKKYGQTYMPDRYLYQPTGRLKLGIVGDYAGDLQKVVADGKKQRIEQHLNEFVVKLEAQAVHLKRQEEHRERRRRLWEEQERQRREREKRIANEIERLKALEETARNWKRAEGIRAYVAAVEEKAACEHGSIEVGSELGRWIAWARHKADWIDPLVKAECPVLDAE
jgi:hypothetical protein